MLKKASKLQNPQILPEQNPDFVIIFEHPVLAEITYLIMPTSGNIGCVRFALKVILIIIFANCSSLIGECFAQSITWQRNYCGMVPLTEVGEDVCSDGGENFYIVGTIDASQGPDPMWVLKINKFGDTIWTRQVPPGWGRAIVASEDGGCVLTGVRNEAFTVKLDSSGNIIWDKTYSGNIVFTGKDILRTLDGGYIVCGSAYYDSAYVFKVDLNGVLQWQKLYVAGYWKIFRKIISAIDGGYITVGPLQNYPSDTGRVLITKIDSLGNIEWEKNFVVNGMTDFQNIVRNSNQYVISGENYNNGNFRVFMKRVNYDGNDLFTKVFTANDNEFSSQIGVINDNKYVVSITKRHYVPPNVNDYARILVIDSTGKILIEKNYYAPLDLVIKSLMPLNNGDILFVGYAEYSPFIRADVYALRTDSILYAPPPIGIESDYSPLPNKFTLFQNYPNPFNPKTSIKYAIPKDAQLTLTIYDITGREIVNINEFTNAGNYSYTFDGTNYASGLYLYKLQAGTFAETKKMVLLK